MSAPIPAAWINCWPKAISYISRTTLMQSNDEIESALYDAFSKGEIRTYYRIWRNNPPVGEGKLEEIPAASWKEAGDIESFRGSTQFQGVPIMVHYKDLQKWLAGAEEKEAKRGRIDRAKQEIEKTYKKLKNNLDRKPSTNEVLSDLKKQIDCNENEVFDDISDDEELIWIDTNKKKHSLNYNALRKRVQRLNK